MTENQGVKERMLVGERVTLVRRGKKGIWQLDFHHKGHRLISTRTRNLKAALRKALILEVQLIEGTFDSQQKKTTSIDLSEAISQFMEYRVTEGNRPGTIARYSSILNRFQDFASKARLKRVDQITVVDLVHDVDASAR